MTITKRRCLKFWLVAAACVLLPGAVKATTWNEPWHEEVMQASDSFVKVRIVEVSGSRGKAEVLKFFGGLPLPNQIDLAGYSKLTLVSVSAGHELGLPFKAGEIHYLFLKKNPKTDEYQIPTPTSGWARVNDGTVAATYRHSYHKALVPEDVYEQTMQAIFNGLKGRPHNVEFVNTFLKTQLNSRVAQLGEDKVENQRFFLQHVALETFYFLRHGAELAQLVPFVELAGFHTQVSACRAVSAIDKPASREALMKFIEGKGTGFAKVMCVWGLKRLNAKEMIPRLKAFHKSGEDQETGFGGSIMDPRIATYFPDSVKAAIAVLLDEWAAPKPTPKAP